MSSSIHQHALIFLLFAVSSDAQFKPKAFIVTIKKDIKTLQYYSIFDISAQVNSVQLVLDLGGQHTWFSCDSKVLSTFKPIMCGSSKCKKYNAKGNGCMRCAEASTPGCTDDSCTLYSYNAFASEVVVQTLGEDAIFVDDFNGLVIGPTYKSPKPFPFTCSDADFLRGLSNETKGMTGLGNTTTSLHAHLSTQFKIPHKFALCLPSTSEFPKGDLLIGGGPYFFEPYGKDIAKELITTPLVTNSVSTAAVYTVGDPSYEYFVDVTYINVDHKPVSFNASLLSINEDGYGGTALSTITPYTKLETSIYEGLVTSFTKAAAYRKMKRVSSVAPFGACYKAKSIAKSHTGLVVPYIDIGLAGNTHWRFYGANSMVSVKKDVLCLAFVDGGSLPRTSIVVGGYQMENYLMEFDLVSSKLGISTSLLFRNTTCTQSRLF